MAREDESTIRDGYGYAEAVIDARGAVRWALVLAGCWALVQLLIRLSWGLWAVTR